MDRMAPKRKRSSRVEKLESTLPQLKKNRTRLRSAGERKKEVVTAPLLPQESRYEDTVNTASSDNKGLLNWSSEDMSELLQRIENIIPTNDNLKYNSRVDKLDWDEIAFNEYSAPECRETWGNIQKRIRRYRLLREVVGDAKAWVAKHYKEDPDASKRPLSSYMLYYKQNVDKVLKSSAKDVTEASKIITAQYRNLSAEEKEKYNTLAATEKKKFMKQKNKLNSDHSDAISEQPPPKTSHSVTVTSKPKKPNTPFRLFYETKMKQQNSSNVDKSALLQDCKEEWKNMNDKDKVFWIDCAIEEERKYLDDLHTYRLANPDFEPIQYKPILTKEEKVVKERAAGKPQKPPSSGYSIYSRHMLVSAEMKKIHQKERLITISQLWKTLTESQKEEYERQKKKLWEQYKVDYANYLKSLSEEERAEELKSNVPKKKPATPPNKSKKKKKKSSTAVKVVSPITPKKNKEKVVTQHKDSHPKTNNSDDVNEALFEGEPEPPPPTPYLLFVKSFKSQFPEHTKDVDLIWQSMSDVQKAKHREVLRKLKYKYMADYEKFLKGLSKEQLKKYSQIKQLKAQAQLDANGADKENESSDISSSDSSCSDSESESS